MRYCRHCGNQHSADTKFCPQTGKPIAPGASPASSTSRTPQPTHAPSGTSHPVASPPQNPANSSPPTSSPPPYWRRSYELGMTSTWRATCPKCQVTHPGTVFRCPVCNNYLVVIQDERYEGLSSAMTIRCQNCFSYKALGVHCPTDRTAIEGPYLEAEWRIRYKIFEVAELITILLLMPFVIMAWIFTFGLYKLLDDFLEEKFGTNITLTIHKILFGWWLDLITIRHHKWVRFKDPVGREAWKKQEYR